MSNDHTSSLLGKVTTEGIGQQTTEQVGQPITERIVLQMDKFYTVVKIIFKLTFRTVVLRRSEWHSYLFGQVIQNTVFCSQKKKF